VLEEESQRLESSEFHKNLRKIAHTLYTCQWKVYTLFISFLPTNLCGNSWITLRNKLTRIVNKTLLRTYCASDNTPFIRSFAEKNTSVLRRNANYLKLIFFVSWTCIYLWFFWYNATTKLVALCVFRYGFKLFATMRILIKLLFILIGATFLPCPIFTISKQGRNVILGSFQMQNLWFINKQL